MSIYQKKYNLIKKLVFGAIREDSSIPTLISIIDEKGGSKILPIGGIPEKEDESFALFSGVGKLIKENESKTEKSGAFILISEAWIKESKEKKPSYNKNLKDENLKDTNESIVFSYVDLDGYFFIEAIILTKDGEGKKDIKENPGTVYESQINELPKISPLLDILLKGYYGYII